MESMTPEGAGEPTYVDGVAGGGALREFERRRSRRRERIASDHPTTGKLRLALSDDPASTRAWATGAVGEMRLGEQLNALAGPTLRVLHDRRIPGSRANIDHLVICASGIVIIDAKRYRDQRPRARSGTLYVGGRDKTSMITGMHRQVEAVRKAAAPDLPADADAAAVRGILCFIGADFPLIGGDVTVQGVRVL